MQKEIVFSKSPARSGKGFLVWIPAKIAEYQDISEGSTVVCSIIHLSGKDQQELTFTKRIARSGKTLMVWIPKDVTDFLEINSDSLCQFRMQKLVRP